MKKQVLIMAAAGFLALSSCKENKISEEEKEQANAQGSTTVETAIGSLTLPPPYETKSVTNRNSMEDWGDKMSKAPEGFTVTKFAGDLDNPRNTYIAPNGDIFVAESNDENKSANRITMFRDKDGDGTFETRAVFKEDLKQPYGMLVLDNYFYVANTDGLYRYSYKEGDTKLQGEGQKIVELPAGGYNHHWTRNLIANADGSKIYISVGSASNVGEYGMDEEKRRANILEINPDGSGERIYASGLRNPVGMAWNPANKQLWAAVNERDELGDELVPDYITSVKEGGFYGWPYSYFGQIEDPRMKGKAPELVKKAIVPDVPLVSHTASLGICFYDKDAFPQQYKNGAFVGQHGSWNRSKISGYKVMFVPFENGKPSGKPQDFLTGFIEDPEKPEVYGRPVDVTVMNDGSLLVNDDAGGTLWKVTANK